VTTLLTAEGFRFFLYANDAEAAPCVHVEKGDGVARFALDPASLAESSGLSPEELRRARELTEEHEMAFLARWNENRGP
jgi:hypothetical protein